MTKNKRPYNNVNMNGAILKRSNSLVRTEVILRSTENNEIEKIIKPRTNTIVGSRCEINERFACILTS